METNMTSKPKHFFVPACVLALVAGLAQPCAAQLPVSFYQGRLAYPAIANTAIAVADFTGDGVPDVATALPFALSVRPGSTGGTLAASISSPLVISCGTVLLTADFNADGKPDLVCPISGGFEVSLGQGNGTFAAPVQTSFSSLIGIAIGNLNQDSIPDVVAWNSSQLAVFKGLGTGAFDAPVTYNYRSLFDVKVGDFDGDSRNDVVVTTKNAVTVFVGRGDGTLGVPRITGLPVSTADYVTLSDLNGDGRLDALVTVNRASNNNPVAHLAVLLGQGDGHFDKSLYNSDHALAAAQLGDIKPGGGIDIAAATSGGIAVFSNDGTGALSGPTTYTAPNKQIALAALRNPGIPDVVLTDGNTVQVVPNDGSGTYVTGLQTAGGATSPPCVTADFNADGKADLACLDSFRVNILLGSGMPALPFNNVGSLTLIGPADALAVGDLDGDGLPDLALLLTDKTIAFVRNTGGGTFAIASARSYSGPESTVIVAADFTGDGKTDLVTGSGLLLPGNGDGTFAPPVSFYSSAPITSLAVADLNGDGRPDLVATRAGAAPAVFVGQTGGTFHLSELNGVEGSYRAVIADLNGDGRLDLAIPAAGFGTSILLGRGDATFLNFTTVHNDFWPATISAAVADFTGDGIPDLAYGLQNYSVWIAPGRGNGTFANPIGYGVVESTSLLAGEFGSVNGSPHTDLLAGSGTITVLLNSKP